MKIRLAYLASRYTGDTKANIERARRLANAAMKQLAEDVLVIPAATLGVGIAETRSLEWWYPATLEVLNRCDVAIFAEEDLGISLGVSQEFVHAYEKDNRPMLLAIREDGELLRFETASNVFNRCMQRIAR